VTILVTISNHFIW